MAKQERRIIIKAGHAAGRQVETMTRAKPKPKQAVDAVAKALAHEKERRKSELKPIEIVKIAISAYQSFYWNSALEPIGEEPGGHDAPAEPTCMQSHETSAPSPSPIAESDDRAGLRRGTQASIDRLLFNVNYWRAAYEDRIIDACSSADDARRCLRAISAWNSHTMKLNTLSDHEVIVAFERFCPPFATNNRRGGAERAGSGKGPVQDFRTCAHSVAEAMDANGRGNGDSLRAIVADVEAESAIYETYSDTASLDALYDLLPAWCLQDRIELVTGTWWNDADVMCAIADALRDRFAEMGYAQALCDYFRDAMSEALDTYQRELSTSDSPLAACEIGNLISAVHDVRESNPNTEADGYGPDLPTWLSAKEQLIWNTVVCAVYGPMHARPLLADNLDLLPVEGKPVGTDVITELAQRAYVNYLGARRAAGERPQFASFALQPEDLRASGIERVQSIPDKPRVLGYRIIPLASCYPNQRIGSLRPSEVECLAILEHRRWCEERTAAGWTPAEHKDISAKQSPYLVDWDDLPDRAREWTRSSVRDIPALLASVGLAVAK